KRKTPIKTNFTSQTAFFIPHVVLGTVLCSIGFLLALAGWSQALTQISSTAAPVLPDSRAAVLPAPGTHANTKLTYKIIDAPKHTYCYDVFADGRLMIHQTSVPALTGNEGFKTGGDA